MGYNGSPASIHDLLHCRPLTSCVELVQGVNQQHASHQCLQTLTIAYKAARHGKMLIYIKPLCNLHAFAAFFLVALTTMAAGCNQAHRSLLVQTCFQAQKVVMPTDMDLCFFFLCGVPVLSCLYNLCSMHFKWMGMGNRLSCLYRQRGVLPTDSQMMLATMEPSS